jgi:NitT/TauT family transport system permease protein
VLWEFIGQRHGALPPPSAIVQAWWVWAAGAADGTAGLYSGTWVSNSWVSLVRVSQGIVLAALMARPIGILIGWSRTVAELLDAPLQLLRPIPITAWVPFSMILFGVADGSTVFLIALGAFFPMVINTTHGVTNTSRTLVRAARMMGSSEWQVLRRVVFPAALPNIFTGLRLGVGVGWVCVVVGEMIAVKSGLGYVMWDSLTYERMDITVISMLSMGLLGALTDWMVVLLSRRVLRWQALESQR